MLPQELLLSTVVCLYYCPSGTIIGFTNSVIEVEKFAPVSTCVHNISSLHNEQVRLLVTPEEGTAGKQICFIVNLMIQLLYVNSRS